jgi:DNA processing protein
VPLKDWLQLSLTDGIGNVLTARLVQAAGSAANACAADRALLEQINGIGPHSAHRIQSALRDAAVRVDDELARCQGASVSLVCLDDPNYPATLRTIPDPPVVLYVRGDLQPRDLNAVAIVGSRRCSHYGREQAERFAALLAGAGLTVISGGARGVDSAAHRGAMAQTNGRTIAVLGSGVDVAYPPENEKFFDQIAQHGAVISEFPMNTPPLKENFPRRNRVVSGLSRGVLVIEADIRSGALITARVAASDHGRPVFALPGRVDNAMSAGAHELIRDGATLVTCLDHILEGLGPLPDIASLPSDPIPTANVDLFSHTNDASEPTARVAVATERQQIILAQISHDPVQLDDIVAAADLPVEVIMQELTLMTLRGMVKRVDGQHYVRRK